MSEEARKAATPRESNQKDKDEAIAGVWHEFLTLPYGDGIGSSYKQAMNRAFEAGIAYHAKQNASGTVRLCFKCSGEGSVDLEGTK